MTKEDSPAKPVYNSNPFSLGFDALGRFFNTNVAWAVVLIVLGFFGAITQLAGNLPHSSTSTTPAPPATAYGAPSSQTAYDATTIIALVIVISVFVLVAVVVGVIINIFLKGMFSYVALESEKGNKVNFEAAFKATAHRFPRLFGSELLAMLKIIGWTMLFIIPGVVAAYRYALLSYVIMDEPEDKKGVKNSHARVKTLVAHRKMEVFGLATVGAIVPFVGSLITLSGNAALYRQMQIYTDHKLEKPGVHWLNYIGFILFAALLLFVLFIAAIVLAIVGLNK